MLQCHCPFWLLIYERVILKHAKWYLSPWPSLALFYDILLFTHDVIQKGFWRLIQSMHPLDYVPVFVWMFLGCLILIIFCFGYTRRDDVVFRFAMDYDVCLRLYRLAIAQPQVQPIHVTILQWHYDSFLSAEWLYSSGCRECSLRHFMHEFLDLSRDMPEEFGRCMEFTI